MEKKSILFVIPWLPYPLSSGGHQAVYNGIVAVKDNYDVVVIYEKKAGDDEAEKHFRMNYPDIVLKPITYPTPSFLHKLASWSHIIIKKIFGERLTHEELICNRWVKTILPLRKEMIMHVDKICQERRFDIIQVEMPWFISLVLSLPKQSKKVFVHHELGFVCRDLEVQNYQKDVYLESYKAYVDLNEIALLNMYDKIVTLSPVDKEKLIRKGVAVPISTSFAIINSISESNFKLCDVFHLTFVGPDSHMPNLMGVLWFLENCWEQLKQKAPKMHLSIIGSWNNTHIQEISSRFKDVEFLGFVDNLQESLQGTIMIVPITIGSGVRMKILEACTIGVPFVSTHVGAEGIPVSNGEDCFLADTPEAFVESIIKLKDIEIQKTFVNNAMRMVQETFSLDAFRKNRIGIYESI